MVFVRVFHFPSNDAKKSFQNSSRPLVFSSIDFILVDNLSKSFTIKLTTPLMASLDSNNLPSAIVEPSVLDIIAFNPPTKPNCDISCSPLATFNSSNIFNKLSDGFISPVTIPRYCVNALDVSPAVCVINDMAPANSVELIFNNLEAAAAEPMCGMISAKVVIPSFSIANNKSADCVADLISPL